MKGTTGGRPVADLSRDEQKGDTKRPKKTKWVCIGRKISACGKQQSVCDGG